MGGDDTLCFGRADGMVWGSGMEEASMRGVVRRLIKDVRGWEVKESRSRGGNRGER